jgi:hypothetical protein
MGGMECGERYGALPACAKKLHKKIERVVINALELVATS